MSRRFSTILTTLASRFESRSSPVTAVKGRSESALKDRSTLYRQRDGEAMNTIDQRIASCDLTLFDHIPSQTSEADRRALLALHGACRDRLGDFVYLEIGSHLGGSLQPYVLDPRCKTIISIDSRPETTPDERPSAMRYPGSTTERMMGNLAGIPDADTSKVHTIQAGTAALTKSDIPAVPDLCFIDAEHTDEAALRDARFCLGLLDGNGCIVLHDCHLLYRAIHTLLEELQESDFSYRPYVLPTAVFVIEVGELTLLDDARIRDCLTGNYAAYLWALRANDNNWGPGRKEFAEARARQKKDGG
jgi:hypothetical protein